MNFATGIKIIARLFTSTTRPPYSTELSVPNPNSIAVNCNTSSATFNPGFVVGTVGDDGEKKEEEENGEWEMFANGDSGVAGHLQARNPFDEVLPFALLRLH